MGMTCVWYLLRLRIQTRVALLWKDPSTRLHVHAGQFSLEFPVVVIFFWSDCLLFWFCRCRLDRLHSFVELMTWVLDLFVSHQNLISPSWNVSKLFSFHLISSLWGFLIEMFLLEWIVLVQIFCQYFQEIISAFSNIFMFCGREKLFRWCSVMNLWICFECFNIFKSEFQVCSPNKGENNLFPVKSSPGSCDLLMVFWFRLSCNISSCPVWSRFCRTLFMNL